MKRRRGEGWREVSQAAGERDVQSEGEDCLFHAPLSLSRVPRMKTQAGSQEMKGHPGVSAQHGEILRKGCQRREED